MSAALDWLRQRRQTPVIAPPPRAANTAANPAASRADSAEWKDVFDTLRRLRERGPRAVLPVAAASTDRRLPGLEIAPGLWLDEQIRPWPRLPESLDLSSLCTSRLRGGHDASAEYASVDTRRLAFFDTETTGLAGGTGTRAFMIGLARMSDAGLVLRQWTIATMAAEPLLLAAFVEALGDDAILVSYNGRSYDRPLLSTRLRLARQADPLMGLPHLDLLYITRRRLRAQLPNCRLSTVERHWLGILREDDLPGSEAPAAWLSFLKGNSAALLRRVGAHNAQDLVSLAVLLQRHLAPA